jgi:hypothetical protein
MLRYFIFPAGLAILVLAAVYIFFGTTAFLTAFLLAILEVTLSFDNAVVNAKVLKQMSPAWQRRFLTWGMLFAVLGARLVLPILIVSATALTAPWTVGILAVTDPATYGALLEHARYAISAFGGAFLIMVSLKYFLDENKTIHWIRAVEKRIAEWGRVESVEIGVTLGLLGVLAAFLPRTETAGVLIAGIIGIVLFIAMEGVTDMFDRKASAEGAAIRGLALFIYLNVLDTAFSLDSVVGAFALTDLIPVIVVGLGIGAYFVRSLTVFLVEKRALDSLKYLEHGAHWAIFGLAASMFASLLVEVPEIVSGTIGLVFVAFAYYSSVVARNLKKTS